MKTTKITIFLREVVSVYLLLSYIIVHKAALSMSSTPAASANSFADLEKLEFVITQALLASYIALLEITS